MTIKKVAYTKTYPILNIGVWEKIYVEAELNEGEDSRKALYECKKVVESFHYESNKAAVKEKQKDSDDIISETGVASLIQQINSCKELKVLESYKFIVKKDADLQNAYNKKYCEITGIDGIL